MYEDYKKEITDPDDIYYIYIKDGKPIGDPISKSNLMLLIKDFETNIPENLKRFYPSDVPLVDTPYKDVLGSSYEVYDNEVYHVYHVREMPLVERRDLIKNYKDWWYKNVNYKGWYFDEWYCRFFPPIQEPLNGSDYYWDNETESWKLKNDQSN